MDDQNPLKRICHNLRRESSLTFKEGQAQLLSAVRAELAGQDIDSIFPELVIALDQYVDLAEEYNELYEDLKAFVGAESNKPRRPINLEWLVSDTPTVFRSKSQQADQQVRVSLAFNDAFVQGDCWPDYAFIDQPAGTSGQQLRAIVYLEVADPDRPLLTVKVLAGTMLEWFVDATEHKRRLPTVEHRAQSRMFCFGPIQRSREELITLIFSASGSDGP